MNLHALFGPGVTLVEGLVGDYQGPLIGAERDRAERMSPARRAQFTAGRHLARMVLRQLGIDAGALPVGTHGEPLWPEGVVGAITHCGNGSISTARRFLALEGRCAVAVASSATHIALGLDIEADTALEPALRVRIIDDAENTAVADNPKLSDMLFFSIKESVYKAVFPLSGRFLDFHDVRVSVDREAMRFVARILPEDWPPVLPDTIAGRYRTSGGLITTTAEVRRIRD